MKPLMIAGALLFAATSAAAQDICRPPNLFTRTKKHLAANLALTKALEFDVRVRGSGAGMRRALAGFTESAHLFGQNCDRPAEFVALTHAAAAHQLLGRADSALATYRRALRVAAQLAPGDSVAGEGRHYVGGPAVARATANHYIGDV